MNRRALASAVAALLIGGGVGATVGSVAANPQGKTVTVVIVQKKKGKTRTVTQTVTRAQTVTETTTVTRDTTGGTTDKKYPDCPDQTDAANCVPPTDKYNPPVDFCSTHSCIATFDQGGGY